MNWVCCLTSYNVDKIKQSSLWRSKKFEVDSTDNILVLMLLKVSVLMLLKVPPNIFSLKCIIMYSNSQDNNFPGGNGQNYIVIYEKFSVKLVQ